MSENREETEAPKKKGGCFSALMKLCVLVVLGGVGYAGYLVSLPQDLSDIAGQGKVDSLAGVRDLKVVLDNSLEKKFPVTLTEKEINEWLTKNIRVEQRGLLSEHAKLERVLVRFESGVAEVIFVRKIKDWTFTHSLYCQLESKKENGESTTVLHLNGGKYHPMLDRPTKGGRFGRLEVPQGFVMLTMPAYHRLAESLKDELQLAVSKMEKVKIESNRVVLEPEDLEAAKESLF